MIFKHCGHTPKKKNPTIPSMQSQDCVTFLMEKMRVVVLHFLIANVLDDHFLLHGIWSDFLFIGRIIMIFLLLLQWD